MKTTRSVAALTALCGLKLHAEVLVPAFLEALHQVIPSARNLFDWTDQHGRLVRYFIEGEIDADIAQLYFDEFHNKREAEAMPAFESLRRQPPGVRGADELDHAGFFRSALYNEVWRPQGLHTRLEAVVRGRDGRLIGSLVLYRGPGDARFTRDDERRLASLLPALAEGLQCNGPAVADNRHIASPEPAQTLLLTLQGQVRHASPGAHRLLLMAEGGASREALSKPLDLLAGRLLPMLLVRLREQASRAPLPGSSFPAPSITHETAAGQFVASARLLRAVDPGHEPLAQVTLQRLEPHAVALQRALRALPLTAGQMAVCRELVLGHSQADIATRLGVATATVVDHVRKAYQALDVRSALELRVLVDSRIGQA
jgi:DNA-binding CsgD family transcriptional regulator